MSGRTGKKPTRRKPIDVGRRAHLAEGASGREKPENVRNGDVDRNIDKAVRKGGAGGA